MSSSTPSDRAELDIQAIIARINRDLAEAPNLRAETERFVAEQRTLIAKEQKLAAERLKLMAEEAKLNRDRGLPPWLAFAGVLGGTITLGQLLLRALGVLH